MDGSGLCCSGYLDRFHQRLAATEKSPHTVEAYGRDVRLFAEWFEQTDFANRRYVDWFDGRDAASYCTSAQGVRELVPIVL